MKGKVGKYVSRLYVVSEFSCVSCGTQIGEMNVQFYSEISKGDISEWANDIKMLSKYDVSV